MSNSAAGKKRNSRYVLKILIVHEMWPPRMPNINCFELLKCSDIIESIVCLYALATGSVFT